jgi:heme-degrading monooxygenase HmoA
MIIQEWSYIPNGSEKPVLVTTWEDYEDFKGLQLAKNHKTENGNFRLYFTNISVN